MMVVKYEKKRQFEWFFTGFLETLWMKMQYLSFEIQVGEYKWIETVIGIPNCVLGHQYVKQLFKVEWCWLYDYNLNILYNIG